MGGLIMLSAAKQIARKALIRVDRSLFDIIHPGWNKVSLPENPRISFCTNCMGRLHHLKETLLRNIEDNRDYPNADFVVLNYNSPDQMENWAKQNLGPFIASGKVKYYRTDEPEYFHMAHAKNVAHKLATGDIVCNLDADNFTGKGFASFLASLFKSNPRTLTHGHWKISRGTTGRIVVLKKFFMLTRGYDERFEGWGAEDLDFLARLTNLGLRPFLLEDKAFLKTLEHDKEESVRYMAPQFHDYRMTDALSVKKVARTKWFGKLSANQGLHWGKARVFKNFGEKPEFI